MVYNSCRQVLINKMDYETAADLRVNEPIDDSDDDFDDLESNSEWDNYGKSTEKYGGYNGYSDDVIDDAFDGFPEATWNVD